MHPGPCTPWARLIKAGAAVFRNMLIFSNRWIIFLFKPWSFKLSKKKKKSQNSRLTNSMKKVRLFFHLFKWKVNSRIYIVVVLYMIHKVLHTWIELQEFISLMTHVLAQEACPPLLVPCRFGGGRKDIHKWSTKPTTYTLMAHLCSRAYKNNVHQTGGGTFAKIVRGCACWWVLDLQNFLYTIFRTIIHPSVTILLVTFSKEKHPISLKLGAFYHSLLKIIWAPSSLMKTHRSLYQISLNSTSKGRHTVTHTFTMSMWEPPPPPGTSGQKNTIPKLLGFVAFCQGTK